MTLVHDSTLNCDVDQDFTLNFNPGHDSTLNCDPGSWFHVELWPQVKLWPGIGITIQCGILTRGHNSTWNFDPGSQFNVEFWPVYIIYLLLVELRLKKVSEFNSVIKIQQLRRVIIQRKIHWILTPGWYSIGGQNFILQVTGISLITNEYCYNNYKISTLINLQNNTDVTSLYGCNGNTHTFTPCWSYVRAQVHMFIYRSYIDL